MKYRSLQVALIAFCLAPKPAVAADDEFDSNGVKIRLSRRVGGGLPLSDALAFLRSAGSVTPCVAPEPGATSSRRGHTSAA